MIELYIKEKRIEKGLTQKQLSLFSKVSESYIGDLERNEKEPSISILCKLANVLEVKVEELYKYYED